MSTVIDGSASVTINDGAILGITRGTAVATTSGTSIDFTSIPSWVKRITVMLNGISTSGTSNPLIQVGSGSVTASGYTGFNARQGATANTYTANSTGFNLNGGSAASSLMYGSVVLVLVSGNTWLCSGVTISGTNESCNIAGNIALGGALDRVRFTTVNGTDTFDLGSINIMYEG